MVDKISKYVLLIACLMIIGYTVWNVAMWTVSMTNVVVGLNNRVTAIEQQLGRSGNAK